MLTESQIGRLNNKRIAQFFRIAAEGKSKDRIMPAGFALDLLGIIAIHGGRIAATLEAADRVADH